MEGKQTNGKYTSKKCHVSTEKNKKTAKRRKKHKSSKVCVSREKADSADTAEDVLKICSSSSPDCDHTDVVAVHDSENNPGADSDSSPKLHVQTSKVDETLSQEQLVNNSDKSHQQKSAAIVIMPLALQRSNNNNSKNRNNNQFPSSKPSRPRLPPETKCFKPLGKTQVPLSVPSRNPHQRTGVLITTGLSSNQNGTSSAKPFNESLRWDYKCEDSDAEQERIKVYKMNRRKRYLGAAQTRTDCWESGVSTSSSNDSIQNDMTSVTETSPLPLTDLRSSQETIVRDMMNAMGPLARSRIQNGVAVM